MFITNCKHSSCAKNFVIYKIYIAPPGSLNTLRSLSIRSETWQSYVPVKKRSAVLTVFYLFFYFISNFLWNILNIIKSNHFRLISARFIERISFLYAA